MREVFRKYPETTPKEERKGSPVCVVSHPDAGGPCGRPAVGEVWGLSFCELHGREAEMSAKEEIAYATDTELQILADSELERPATNHYVLEILQAAKVPYEVDYAAHAEARLAAYPPDELEAHTDRDTLRFDYDRDYAGDGPVDWWSDGVIALCRFLREAHDRGLPGLVADLEYLRERATVQVVLADRDYERRYVQVRRAALEAAKQA